MILVADRLLQHFFPLLSQIRGIMSLIGSSWLSVGTPRSQLEPSDTWELLVISEISHPHSLPQCQNLVTVTLKVINKEF